MTNEHLETLRKLLRVWEDDGWNPAEAAAIQAAIADAEDNLQKRTARMFMWKFDMMNEVQDIEEGGVRGTFTGYPSKSYAEACNTHDWKDDKVVEVELSW